MGTRVEIFKDGKWKQLELGNSNSIKYNALINRIGNIASREISHTNTFSLPTVYQNTQALGLNVFNARELALALNSKYQARYYVEDKLLQRGYLVINNTSGGTINVNFIDEALDITEQWGTTSYQDLLKAEGDFRPADFIASISELRNYVADKSLLLPSLTPIGSRGYQLALYPNSLNMIGDEFQKNINGDRVDDSFNPYQSRPVFNVKAMFDLACEAYGYTPIYDNSVDWSIVEKTYISPSGMNENQRDDGGITSTTRPVTTGNQFYDAAPPFEGEPNLVRVAFEHEVSVGIRPNDITGWTDPSEWPNPGSISSYRSQRVIFKPLVDEANVGEITMSADFLPTGGAFVVPSAYAVWKNDTNTGVRFKPLTPVFTNTGTRVTAVFDKTAFETPPSNSGDFLGVMYQIIIETFATGGQIFNKAINESYIPGGIISYDDYGQFVPTNIDFTYAAPRESLKKLMSAAMQKEGILLSISGKDKTIKFFTYGQYQTQKEVGNFRNWSKYFQRYSNPLYNTDYGNNYAKKNRIGLQSPYIGNTNDILVNNQGVESKYKDFTESYVELFKDVSLITKVNNTTTPYFEYTNLGLGLVEQEGSLGTLTQRRADGTSQGTFSGLDSINNVNYGIIPKGVSEWYKLVDQAVRVEADFLLPVSEVRDLDLSVPVYINDLGGYWIVEEIAEYVNPQTIVKVKLIKLIDNLIT